MATKKKGYVDENESGEWDTSITDPPKKPREPSPYDDTDFDVLGRLPTSEEGVPDAPDPPAASIPAPAGERATPAPAARRSDYKGVPSAAEMSASGTTIGPTIVVRGKMRTDEHLVVKGRMEAHIKSAKDLRVEASGVVNANIDVHAVAISGIVVGDITASELVELSPEARVIGDIRTPRLIVHDGAKFRGKILMDGLEALELVRPQPAEELELEELEVEEVAPPVKPPSLDVPRPGVVVAPTVRPPGKNVVASPTEPMTLKPSVGPRETGAPPPPPINVAPTARPAAAPRPAPAPAPAPTPAPAPAQPPGAAGAEKGASAGWFGRRNS
jgi:cytoskeletal protein CcmA (bactofilin family)